MNQNALLKIMVHLGHIFKSRFQTFLASSPKSTKLDFRTLHGIILIKSNLGISQVPNTVATLHVLKLKKKK